MPTYLELKKQAEDLLHQAEAARKAEIGAAIAEIKAKMAAYGITVDDLDGRKRVTKGRKPRAVGVAKSERKAGRGEAQKSPKARKPVAAKYRNAETGGTWSGRGKPPRWLAAAEAAGRKREEFAVSQ
ncbi:MAG: H-NS histone family protein [Rhodocyclales bacterium]|nr:H-NS histone family protein [Rhodocyclales bacterium]